MCGRVCVCVCVNDQLGMRLKCAPELRKVLDVQRSLLPSKYMQNTAQQGLHGAQSLTPCR